jgi:hypothetical protein
VISIVVTSLLSRAIRSTELRILSVHLDPAARGFIDEDKARGVRMGPHRILRCTSPAIPNAIAALLLHVRDATRAIPDAYFGWTEGNPLGYVLRYLAFGEGDTAPVTREVPRKRIKKPLERPRIHVG